jgi:transcription elongation GreA/GreB family factor
MREIIDNFRNHIHCMRSIKEEIHQTLIKQVEDQLLQAKQDLGLAKESRDSDTKSSAGDKYETGREMMQREMDKLSASLDIYQQQLVKLKSIDPQRSTDFVTHGSLIETNFETYYMAIGMGQITYANQTIYAISPESPLGTLLMGKRVEDSFDLRGRNIIIKSIS